VAYVLGGEGTLKLGGRLAHATNAYLLCLRGITTHLFSNREATAR
jgi:hypothetical protein